MLRSITEAPSQFKLTVISNLKNNKAVATTNMMCNTKLVYLLYSRMMLCRTKGRSAKSSSVLGRAVKYQLIPTG